MMMMSYSGFGSGSRQCGVQPVLPVRPSFRTRRPENPLSADQSASPVLFPQHTVDTLSHWERSINGTAHDHRNFRRAPAYQRHAFQREVANAPRLWARLARARHDLPCPHPVTDPWRDSLMQRGQSTPDKRRCADPSRHRATARPRPSTDRPCASYPRDPSAPAQARPRP